jgi:hypothetical protein
MHLDAAGGGKTCQLSRRFERDRAHVDPYRAGPSPGQDAVRCSRDHTHVWSIGEHRDHDIGPRGQLSRSGRYRRAGFLKVLGLGARAVENGKGVAGVDKSSSHARAHEAQTDKANRRPAGAHLHQRELKDLVTKAPAPRSSAGTRTTS